MRFWTWCATGDHGWLLRRAVRSERDRAFPAQKDERAQNLGCHRNVPHPRRQSVRAQSIRGRMAVRGLYVPAGAPWLHDFRSELLAFPVGKHDDICDSLGLVGQIIDRMSKGSPLPQKTPPKILAPIPAPAPSPSRTCSKQTNAGARSLVGEFRGNGTNDPAPQPLGFGYV